VQGVARINNVLQRIALQPHFVAMDELSSSHVESFSRNLGYPRFCATLPTDGSSQGSEEERNPHQKASRGSKKSLACPYAKLDKQNKKSSSCSFGGKTSMWGIIQHLKTKRHRLGPLTYCKICWKFSRSDHCTNIAHHPKEGKSLPQPRGEKQKELWLELFRLLFPGSVEPVSPCQLIMLVLRSYF
jgi:hypothetical protein